MFLENLEGVDLHPDRLQLSARQALVIVEGSNLSGAGPAFHPGLLPGLAGGGLVRPQPLDGPSLRNDPSAGLAGSDEQDLDRPAPGVSPGQDGVLGQALDP